MEEKRGLNKGRADTDYKKEDVIRVLLSVWKKFPELRLGQLLEDVRDTSNMGSGDLFYIEDTSLRDLLILFGAQRRNK